MIRQTSFFLALLFLPILAFSQNNLSFGIQVQPKLSFYNTPDIVDGGSFPITVGRGTDNLGFSIGAFIQYDLGSKLFIRSGLSHESTKFQNTIQGALFPDDMVNGTTSTIQYTAAFSFASIPLDIAYRFTPKDRDVNVHVGLGAAVNLTNSVTQRMSIMSDERPDDLASGGYNPDPASYSFGLFGGVEFSLGKKLGLAIEPRLKFTPNKFTWFFRYESQATTEASVAVRFRLK